MKWPFEKVSTKSSSGHSPVFSELLTLPQHWDSLAGIKSDYVGLELVIEIAVTEIFP